MSQDEVEVQFHDIEPTTDGNGLLLQPCHLEGAEIHSAEMNLDSFRLVLVNHGIVHPKTGETLNASVVELTFHRPEAMELLNADRECRLASINLFSRNDIIPHWAALRAKFSELPEHPTQLQSAVLAHLKVTTYGDIFVACRKLTVREARTSAWQTETSRTAASKAIH